MFVVDAHHLIVCGGGVCEWTKQVEDGGETKRLAHRTSVLHGGVMVNREAEADSGFADAASLDLRRCIDVDTKTLEHFGAASPGAAAVAMLGDSDFGGGCGGGENRGEGGDVEGFCCAARATGVEQGKIVLGKPITVDRHGGHVGTHRASGTDDFFGGGGALGEEREQSAGLGGIKLSLEELLKERLGLLARESLALDEGEEQVTNEHGRAYEEGGEATE